VPPALGAPAWAGGWAGGPQRSFPTPAHWGDPRPANAQRVGVTPRIPKRRFTALAPAGHRQSPSTRRRRSPSSAPTAASPQPPAQHRFRKHHRRKATTPADPAPARPFPAERAPRLAVEPAPARAPLRPRPRTPSRAGGRRPRHAPGLVIIKPRRRRPPGAENSSRYPHAATRRPPALGGSGPQEPVRAAVNFS